MADKNIAMQITDNISGTLARLMSVRGTNPKRLSKDAGLNETFVRDLIKGRTENPGIESLRKLALALDCSISTLLDEAEQLESEGTAPLVELDVRAAGGAGLDVEHDGKRVSHIWRVPTNIFQAQTSAPISSLKIITIYGDSMEPDLPAGTRVVVDTSDLTPTPPGVFVVWDGLGLVAKRVEHIPHSDPPRVRLKSDNPHYGPYEVTLEEAHIQGRVMGRWKWM